MRLKSEYRNKATLSIEVSHFNELVSLINGVEKQPNNYIKVYTPTPSTLKWYMGQNYFKNYWKQIGNSQGNVVILCNDSASQLNLFEILIGIRNHGPLTDMQSVKLDNNTIIPYKYNGGNPIYGTNTPTDQPEPSVNNTEKTVKTTDYTTWIIIGVAAIIIGILIIKKRK